MWLKGDLKVVKSYTAGMNMINRTPASDRHLAFYHKQVQHVKHVKCGQCRPDMPSADSKIYLHTFEILNVPTYIIFTVFWRFYMNLRQHLFYKLYLVLHFSVNCNYLFNE